MIIKMKSYAAEKKRSVNHQSRARLERREKGDRSERTARGIILLGKVGLQSLVEAVEIESGGERWHRLERGKSGYECTGSGRGCYSVGAGVLRLEAPVVTCIGIGVLVSIGILAGVDLVVQTRGRTGTGVLTAGVSWGMERWT